MNALPCVCPSNPSVGMGTLLTVPLQQQHQHQQRRFYSVRTSRGRSNPDRGTLLKSSLISSKSDCGEGAVLLVQHM